MSHLIPQLRNDPLCPDAKEEEDQWRPKEKNQKNLSHARGVSTRTNDRMNETRKDVLLGLTTEPPMDHCFAKHSN